MNVRQLAAALLRVPDQELEVVLEVGGDGAVHEGTVRNVFQRHHENQVVLSSE